MAGPHRRRPDEAPRRVLPSPVVVHAARDAVCRHIAHQAERFPQLDLHPLVVTGLEPRDAALAHAISDIVIRRWLTLAYLLNTRLSQPLEAIEPPLRAAMLVGAAQIFFLDRVPAYAAIDHAVEWAKLNIRPGAGGMVNAVLRRMSELRLDPPEGVRPSYSNKRDKLPLADGGAVLLASGVLPDEDAPRVCVATSTPIELLRDWSTSLGIAAARAMAMHSIGTPPVTLNTAHAEPSTLPGPELLAPHEKPGCHVFVGEHPELLETLSQREDLWVQDASSCAAVRSIADLKPALIIDLCAGQGTKTRQLCATFPEAHIIASDTDERRRAVLADVFKSRRQVRVKTPDEVLAEHAGAADLILLDVPCSNTGVLARRPEAKYRYSARSIADLVGIQHSIFEKAMGLLSDRPSSAMLYSTCSVDRRENQEQVKWVCERSSLTPWREAVSLPVGGPGQPVTKYADGAYSVLLTRGR